MPQSGFDKTSQKKTSTELLPSNNSESTQNSLAGPMPDLSDWVKRNTTSALSDLVSHFLLSCRSTHTRRAYALDIRGFLEFSERIGVTVRDAHDITEKLALLWNEDLREKHSRYQGSRRRVVQTSVARHLSALFSIFLNHFLPLNFASLHGFFCHPYFLLVDLKGIPNSLRRAKPSSSVFAVVTKLISIPIIE